MGISLIMIESTMKDRNNLLEGHRELVKAIRLLVYNRSVV